MKLKINHFDKKTFEDKLNDVKHLDFSLFVDAIPEPGDFSSINILVLQEPNEYFGIHDWAIQNNHSFNAILTWDDKVLNNCENALLLHFGHTWFTLDQYITDKEKKFEIAHLRGNLLKTYGHSLRHELLNRENEIIIPKKFYASYGERYNIEDASQIDENTMMGLREQAGGVAADVFKFNMAIFFGMRIGIILSVRRLAIFSLIVNSWITWNFILS